MDPISHRIVLLACAVAVSALRQDSAPAQIPHPVEVPRSVPHESVNGEARDHETAADKERRELDEVRRVGSTTYHLAPGERLRIPEEEAVFNAALHEQPVEILWQRAAGPNHTIKFNAYRQDQGVPPPGTYIDGNVLMQLQQSSISVIHSGDIPYGTKWQEFASSHSNAVVHLSGSQNDDPGSIALASALGVTGLSSGTTKIFNALPQQTGSSGLRERTRMGLQQTGTSEAWQDVNDRIRQHETPGFEAHVATREALLDEFANGSSDVVVVYAHFDGKRLHLPGDPGTLAENTISVDEIARIQRRGDPKVKQRIIVLAACSTASPVEGRSLAQVLLKNGIARTVFATDHPYDARQIPDLITRLKTKSVRDADGQLHQYVELRLPSNPTQSETSHS